MNPNCLLFYLKFPEKDKVKTRLSLSLDSDFVVELYKNFIIDLLETLKKVDTDVRICFHPEESKEKLVEWLGDYDYKLQIGKDLGERLKNSFLEAIGDGYEKVIVIGSDSPDLPSELLEKSFVSLNKNDSVIGPATDGGYYLLGFRRDATLPKVFEGIEWSSSSVFVNTIRKLGQASHITHILPALSDVDELDDLKDLIKRSQKNEFVHSNTMKFLLKNKELFVRAIQ